MNIHDATEYAYKNGYEAERKRLEEMLEQVLENPTLACPRFGKKINCDGCDFDKGYDCNMAGRYANYLLDNGIVVPPVKVGDKLYTTYCYGINDWRIEESVVYEVRQRIGTGLEIFEMRRSKNGTYSYFKVELDKFGKTVFLTREEAEKALEGIGE